MVSHIWPATGLQLFMEVDTGSLTASTQVGASGCENLQDLAPGVGKRSLRSLWNYQELAHGSLGHTEAEDDSFSGSWTPQMPLDASEELKIE